MPPIPRPESDAHAPPRRPLFSKPTWSSGKSLGGQDLFHRSDQVYVRSALEAERDRKKKQQRRSIEKSLQAQSAERATKRRRLSSASSSESDQDSNGDDEEESSVGRRKEEEDETRVDVSLQTSLHNDQTSNRLTPFTSPTNQRSVSRISEKRGSEKRQSPEDISARNNLRDYTREESSPEIIEVLSAQDGQQHWAEQATAYVLESEVQAVAEVDADGSVHSEDEFPELAREARERAQRRRLEQVTSPTPPPPSNQSIFGHRIGRSSQSQDAPDISSEIVVQLFVHSTIPNTQPLVVKRKLGQRLKDVRLAWIGRQEIGDLSPDEIFLTWRGKRLFDVTTCKSLGLTVDSSGNVIVQGDIIGEAEARVEVEAMTAAIFEARQKGEPAIPQSEGERSQAGGDEPHETSEGTQLRIFLTARGYEDLKLKVRPKTRISKMINAFRQTHSIEQHSEVFIKFDGERLSPESLVEENEILDLDHLDVYVR